MKKRVFIGIGLFTIILGIAMFLLGVSLFTYQGPPLNPLVNIAGKYSFLYWLPTIGVGILFLILSRIRGK